MNKIPKFSNLGDKLKLEFDYEINSIKLDENDELDCKMYYYDKKETEFSNNQIIKESLIIINIGTL
jgi:hypothetical protein